MLSSAVTHSWFATQDWETDPVVAGWGQHRRARWAWRKLRKARRWACVLAYVPGVRMIAVGNALGYGNCRDDSDIDLVIITAPRRIWTVRLLVVALLKLFRQRPGEHTRDALCPSFFLTTDALNLEPLQMSKNTEQADGVSFRRVGEEKSHASQNIGAGEISRLARNDTEGLPSDPYLLFWTTQLTVLYDRDNTYEQFWDTNVPWVRRWLPDAEPRSAHTRFMQRSPMTQFCTTVQNCVTRFLYPLEQLVERWAKRVQEPRLRRLFPNANTDTSVVIRDDMLKFHTNDRRAEFRDRWIAEMTA